jgi:predicted dehydrogenase
VDAGLTPPPNEPDLDRLLQKYEGQLDAAFICTPHAYHHDQTVACLLAGLDVLLEKPMVMNAEEARSLIKTRDLTGQAAGRRLPRQPLAQHPHCGRDAARRQVWPYLEHQRHGLAELGTAQVGQWRQVPEISGGGFLFDTGAHMLNTVADLAGEDFVEVSAWLDNNGRPVDTRATVMAKLASGAMVTIHGCGEAIPSCASDIRVFCEKAIINTGVWGERLSIQRHGREACPQGARPASLGVWEQFLGVRDGTIVNPCPPEVGLRMAKLWDAIQASSAQGGAAVRPV